MPATLLHALDPVARFVEIYQAFQPRPIWSAEGAWLRFAAQAAVMRPAAPAVTARAIQDAADELRRGAGWFDALGTPLNLVVAALIVQTGDTPAAFAEAVPAARRLYRAAGLPHGSAHELKATAILRVLNSATGIGEPTVARMKEIYDQMKARHWWLTGAGDLPACALLTALPGTANAIASAADEVFHALRAVGLVRSQHLQTAANLVPLSGLAPEAGASRYLALARLFQERGAALWSDDYDAVALLCLLDHEPAAIVDRVLAIAEKVDALDPPVPDPVGFNVAVDLAFLDLARFDRRMRSIADHAGMEAVQALIRRQRAASTVLVQVPVQPGGVDPFDLQALP